ncbi:hypothetical protein [Neobacillus niacini]|uniref:hypothetical protein n=1 Tax=Neobacillus niacini TaxID=86668 RepID=UPI003982D95C
MDKNMEKKHGRELEFVTFVVGSSVSQSLINNSDAAAVFSYLSEPENIKNMIVFSDMQLPVLTGIVKSLEETFQTSKDFSLVVDSNRQTVGKMISFIMDFFGYSPIRHISSSEKRLRNFSGARYFKSSAIYEKTHEPKLQLQLKVITKLD